MPSKPAIPRYCWDSNVILALINGEQGRVGHVQAFLDQAGKNQIEVLTSMLSVSEVAFATEEKAQGQLDIQVRRKIDALWLPSSPIKRVEYHFGIAQDARELIRSAVVAGWTLKPADAIHLATATRMNVAEFHTYEKEATRKKWASLLGGITVDEPQHHAPGMGI